MTPAGRTAIARRGASAPLRYLLDRGLVRGRVLDYGCGRGRDVEELRGRGFDAIGWDPEWWAWEDFQAFYHGRFDTILCTYVLNVIQEARDRENVIRSIRYRLEPGGSAFLTVRRDLPALRTATQVLVRLPLSVQARAAGRWEMYRVDG